MELQPGERKLWNHVLDQHEKRPEERLRIDPIAKQLGMNPQRARQFVRTWKNRGWVDFSVSAERFWVIEAKPIEELPDNS